MSTEMWICECENICNFLCKKNIFNIDIENENLILDKIKDYNTYLDEKSLLLAIKLSLNEIKRVQSSFTTDRF